MSKQFKIYPKVNEPVATPLSGEFINKIGANSMPLSELVSCFRSFYRDVYPKLFDMVVKQIWLEQKFTFNGVRRGERNHNGHSVEKAFSHFMTGMVGISQKVLTNNAVLFSTVSYFSDFFPNFSDHNPFESPEYFKFPYDHVTIDFLYVVRNYHDRIELLNYAEKHQMTIKNFIDWAVNQAMCYNIEKGEDIYEVVRNNSYFVYLKKVK